MSYANSGHLGFTSDDLPIIVDNLRLKPAHRIVDLFRVSYWDRGFPTTDPIEGEYRPLTMASYAWTHRIAGLQPQAFHLGNVLIHLLNSLLVFWIARQLRFSDWQAGVAGVFFAVLTIHTEAVSNTVGRADLFACLFTFISWGLLLENRSRMRFGFAMGSYFLALLSKESAIGFPAALLLSDFFRNEGSLREAMKRRWPQWVGIATVSLVYLGVRWSVLHQLTYETERAYFPEGAVLERLLTMSHFICRHYLLPMTTGLGLCADFTKPAFYDATMNPVARWAFFLCISGGVSVSVYAFFRQRRPWAFCVLLFFGLLLPFANVFIRIPIIGAERFMYLPSVGFCLGLGLFGPQRAVKDLRLVGLIGLAFLAIGMAYLSFERNRVWESETTLWTATYPVVPDSPRALNGLGLVHASHRNYAQARAMFLRALDIAPPRKEYFANLARCSLAEGKWKETQQWAEKGLSLDPDDRLLLWLLGRGAQGEHQRDKAEAAYRRALEIDPSFSLAQRGLLSLNKKP